MPGATVSEYCARTLVDHKAHKEGSSLSQSPICDFRNEKKACKRSPPGNGCCELTAFSSDETGIQDSALSSTGAPRNGGWISPVMMVQQPPSLRHGCTTVSIHHTQSSVLYCVCLDDWASRTVGAHLNDGK